MKKEFKPNLHLLELCLTYRCNIKCNNCSNLCTQAPHKGDLTPDKINYFLNDLVENNNPIRFITLHGGEPVLNPYINEIIEYLIFYRKITGTKLWLLTNNSCHEIREKITRISIDYDIPLGIATKNNDSKIPYVPVNESPFDFNTEYTIGCFQTENCGICFNEKGYFPCSPMAAASRVFGYQSLGYSIKDVTEERCIEYFNLHCKHCGFAFIDRSRVTEQTTSKTWKLKLEEYRQKGAK